LSRTTNDYDDLIILSENIYYQNQLANEITRQGTEIIRLLTSSLNIHLNLEQNLILNTSEVFLSLETISIQSLSNKTVKQVGNGQIYFPEIFNGNEII
jgi:hypothetical protein